MSLFTCAMFAYVCIVCYVDFVKSCDSMWKQSVWTSVLACQCVAHHLNT